MTTPIIVAASMTTVFAVATLDPTVLAASIVTVLAALTAAIVTVVNALAAARDRKVVHDKMDEGAVKMEQVHTLVNSRASAAEEKLTLLETKITELHAQLDSVQERRVEDAKTREAGIR